MRTAGMVSGALCPECRAPFTPRAPHQRYCADPCRYVARERTRRQCPDYVATRRARSRAWDAAHRGVQGREPWLVGAPPYPAHLPGMVLGLDADPAFPESIVHQHVRGLHGMASTLLRLDGGHDPRIPDFALVPWSAGIGWALYVRDEARARELARTRHAARLGDTHTTMRLAPLFRLRAPVVTRRGRRRLRLDAITPVVSRCDGGTTAYTAPTTDTLVGTIEGILRVRLGLPSVLDDLRLEMIERHTFAESVPLAKLGAVRGWLGYVLIETNAVGEWLLRCAALIGLGGRVAFGFGRVAVRDA